MFLFRGAVGRSSPGCELVPFFFSPSHRPFLLFLLLLLLLLGPLQYLLLLLLLPLLLLPLLPPPRRIIGPKAVVFSNALASMPFPRGKFRIELAAWSGALEGAEWIPLRSPSTECAAGAAEGRVAGRLGADVERA